MLALLAAALVTATPATLEARLSAASPGDTVVLAAGDYGAPSIASRSWGRPVTLDAGKARFTGLTLARVQGLTVVNATVRGVLTDRLFTPVIRIADGARISFRNLSVIGPGASSSGINAQRTTGLTVDGASFTGLHRGIVLSEVSDARFSNVRLFGMRSDGIDIAASHRVLVDRIDCSDFHPVPPDHPDCVQLWSIAGKPPTSDVTVRNSRATGDMQGFSGFNHVRNGIDDGGFDRITITGNTVRNTYPSAISLFDARDSLVSGNDVATLPGARFWSQIHVVGGARVREDGNAVARAPGVDGAPAGPADALIVMVTSAGNPLPDQHFLKRGSVLTFCGVCRRPGGLVPRANGALHDGQDPQCQHRRPACRHAEDGKGRRDHPARPRQLRRADDQERDDGRHCHHQVRRQRA